MLLNDLLETSAYLFPQKVAIICQAKRYTYFEIDSDANSFGKALIEKGFQKQDRVIIYLDNSFESVISIFGILKAGGIFVVINAAVKPRKLETILSDCIGRVLITDSKHVMELSAAGSSLSGLAFIVVTDPEKNNIAQKSINNVSLFSFREMIEGNEPAPFAQSCIDIDLASLIYTSGSSGSPKGVMLTHHNMISAVNSITKYLENNQDDIIINTLPLSFDYGLYQILMAFKFGASVVLENGFIFPEQIINLVVKENVTGWPMVPTIVAILCRLKNLGKHDFSHLRYITSTGQVLPTSHIYRLREVFPGVKIYSMYGLTECKRVSYLPPQDIDRKPGSVGKSIPNTEVYLVDDKGQEINGGGIAGELVVRGSNVMQGYWNLPELTERVLRPGRHLGEKVLYTGDLFKKDDEGYLYFLGRKDDIIKTSGYMVSPKEVENVISEMEDVIEAAVIGVPDDILGQAVKAYVHLSDSSKVKEKDILQFCYQNLESYAIPKYIKLFGPLPKTESGKINKRELL
jgi:amino acid adenylation domain-containing protein